MRQVPLLQTAQTTRPQRTEHRVEIESQESVNLLLRRR